MSISKVTVALLLDIILISCLACNSTTTQAPTITPTATPVATSTADWVGPNGEKQVEYVPQNGGYRYGADGHRIELINNLSAHDTDWQTLQAFLQVDQTDMNLYNVSTFAYTDYAEMLHNNAETAGIRAAVVSVEFNNSGRPWWYLLNAFNVSDRGLIYIDDAGVDQYCGGANYNDKIVDPQLNQPYHAHYLFTNVCFYLNYSYSYIVRNISVQWGEAECEYVPIGGYESGADGHLIKLINNPQANDPTWQELKNFLEQDETDTYLYSTSTFVCADFAEMLHNNAEAAGIRAAFVAIGFVNQDTGHALNAFNTSDVGLVYIDDTGGYSHQPCSGDKKVDVELGEEYNPIAIFPCEGVSFTSILDSWGNVSRCYILW